MKNPIPFIYNKSNYSVFNDGSVYSHKAKRFLKQQERVGGYYAVTLRIDNKSKLFFTHRLVGLHFIPNPNNLPEINHKDLNKKNNCHANLEWITHADNMAHARQNKYWHGNMYGRSSGFSHSCLTKKKMSIKKVGILHPRFKGYYVVHGKKYASSYAASKAVGISRFTIAKRCRGSMKYDGYSFER